MQETVTDVKCIETVFSCRKCREKLYGADCLIDEHGTGIASISQHKSSCTGLNLGDAANTVWFINERSLPDWMEQLVNEANWIKGKLMCPKCRSRVGSFDYVSGSKCPCGQVVLPPVHVVKAKVDLKDPLSVPFLRRPSGTEDCATSSVELEKHETEDSKEFPSQKKFPVVFEESSSSKINKTFEKTQTEDEKGLDTLVVGTSQINIKKCRKTREKRTEKLTSECKEKTINDAPKEPPEDVICPVCLDIYTNPFICYPCVHVFCEICLRHIAKRDPQKTLCPLCRQQIGMCLPDHDRYHRVRTLYPTAHKSRQKTLQNLRDFPLPWQPHYRLRQLSNVGRSFLCNERGFIAGETYAASSMWNTISTVALLVFLQIVAMLAFFIGYHGGKYVLGIVDLFFIFAEYAVQVVFGHYWPPSISDIIGCTRYNFNDTVLCI